MHLRAIVQGSKLWLLLHEACLTGMTEATRYALQHARRGDLPREESYQVSTSKFDWDVLRSFQKLLGRAVHVDEARALLGVYPASKTLAKLGMTRLRWVEYHYGNYVVAHASLYDLTLVLANAVFDLGLSHRHCTPDIIKNNYHVRATPVRGCLQELEGATQQHRATRNAHLHRGESPPMAGVLQSSTFDLVGLLELLVGEADKAVLEEALKGEVTTLFGLLDTEIESLGYRTLAVLDAIEPVYRARSPHFRSTALTDVFAKVPQSE